MPYEKYTISTKSADVFTTSGKLEYKFREYKDIRNIAIIGVNIINAYHPLNATNNFIYINGEETTLPTTRIISKDLISFEYTTSGDGNIIKISYNSDTQKYKFYSTTSTVFTLQMGKTNNFIISRSLGYKQQSYSGAYEYSSELYSSFTTMFMDINCDDLDDNQTIERINSKDTYNKSLCRLYITDAYGVPIVKEFRQNEYQWKPVNKNINNITFSLTDEWGEVMALNSYVVIQFIIEK